ncbi:hypothetical protein KY366_00485, partial [Candidatus Woesearchaeota archaeon]|nr:hypothetical protein [Candidatus Woesearchaeota archaeon]
MKYMKGLLVLVLVSILACGLVKATSYPVTESFGAGQATIEVEVNNVGLDPANPKNLEKTDELDVLVTLRLEGFGNITVEDVQIEVELKGYDLSDKDKVNDETDAFNVKVGQVYDKRLSMELPARFDQGKYSLKVRLDSPIDDQTFTFPL